MDIRNTNHILPHEALPCEECPQITLGKESNMLMAVAMAHVRNTAIDAPVFF